MKRTIVCILLLQVLMAFNTNAQSNEDLKSEIEQLRQQNQLLMQMLQNQQQNMSQQQYQAYQQQPSQTMFGQAVQRSRIEELSLTATGTDLRAYGREQSAKSNFARNKAENQARMQLARQIEAYSRYAINQYNEETTAGGNSGIDVNDQESAITAAKQVVEGAKIIDTQEYYDPNTKMYTWEVCVAYDRAGLYAVMEEQSTRIKINKAKFEQDMQRYFDEMDHMQGRLTEAEKAQAVQNQMQQDRSCLFRLLHEQEPLLHPLPCCYQVHIVPQSALP